MMKQETRNNYFQDWNQGEYWVFADGIKKRVDKLSKRDILGILFAVHMLVSKHPKTLWVYQTILWSCVCSRAKSLTIRKELL